MFYNRVEISISLIDISVLIVNLSMELEETYYVKGTYIETVI